jgi:NAD+ synthase (glutamine-hydrolysing)
MGNTMLAMGYATPIRIAAASPAIALGDPATNAEAVIRMIRRAEEIGADYLALPELCLTGATLGSLLKSEVVLEAAKAALTRVCEATRQCGVTAAVGLPYVIGGMPRSCIALIRGCRVIAIIPSSSGENPFGFMPAMDRTAPARQPLTPVSKLAAGFGNELFRGGHEPREGYVMLLSSALNATAKSYHETKDALCAFTARTGMAVAYASPGAGESTTAFIFDGLCAVASQGEILAVSEPLEAEPFVYADVQPDRLSSFEPYSEAADEGTYLSDNPALAREQARRILDLQAAALARRINHIGVRGCVVGISGGLDSALTLLACCAAMDRLGKPRADILGLSMPGFGTTGRTRGNAEALVKALDCTYREISVVPACRQHFADIGHDENARDTVFENAQARERTKILLDIANGGNLLDVGTGDLSEAALGWTTFGGDHLAQYGVNASIPKTVIRRVVREACVRFPEAAETLEDILATPVSPELLPPEDGTIAQKTEELVGAYEMHDFFIWHFMKGLRPRKIYEEACDRLDYPQEEIYRVLGIFLRRFFSQQYKRNCAPEAPLICLSLGPCVLEMPSDLDGRAFLREYEAIGTRIVAIDN